MNPRILVIDDSDDIHDLVRFILKNEAVSVECALDGASGFALSQTLKPDLILLDIDMPAPDGFEICRQLKSEPALSSIPVVFLTAASSTEEKVRGLDLGAADYITKPFDAAELRARVGVALRTKHLMDLLARRALIDGLTELFNRTYFDQRLAAELSLAERNSQELSCLMIDVDHFKSVNDKYGHAAGDVVLRNVGQVIESTCRLQDVVCRYGGEEFAIVAPNTSGITAMTLAGRIISDLAAVESVFRDQRIRVTCSIGVSELINAGEHGIVQAADQALYLAKQSGRNRAHCTDSAPIAA